MNQQNAGIQTPNPIHEQIRIGLEYSNIMITDQEMRDVCDLMYHFSGVTSDKEKGKQFVLSRLIRRLQVCKTDCFSEYLDILKIGDIVERQHFIDALTTNETYFFREINHFNFIEKVAIPNLRKKGAIRVWSAASSAGQEAYSLSFLLDEHLGIIPWEVVGTDISENILSTAKRGIYPHERLDLLPKKYLTKYFLKGHGPMSGKILITPNLKSRVKFFRANLTQSLPEIGTFEIAFLRNVLIYFNKDKQRRIVKNVLSCLRPGGYLFIGTSEYTDTSGLNLNQVEQGVYLYGGL